MKHLVYKTTNLVNGKYYIGVHSCKCNPCRYLGSGVALKAAIRKYGRDSFKRQVLREFNTREDAFEYEALLVDSSNPMCYNLSSGGLGGRLHSNNSKAKMSMVRRGIKFSNVHRINLSKAKYIPVLVRGKLYESISDCSFKSGIPRRTLVRYLDADYSGYIRLKS